MTACYSGKPDKTEGGGCGTIFNVIKLNLTIIKHGYNSGITPITPWGRKRSWPVNRLIYVLILAMGVSGFAANDRGKGPSLEVDCAVTIAVPLGTQKKVKVSPKWVLDHSHGPCDDDFETGVKFTPADWEKIDRRRVTDIAFLSPAGGKASILTSGEDSCIRHFPLGKSIPDHGVTSSQTDGSSLWSASIAAIAPDHTFFVMEGGLSSPVVYYDPSDLSKSKKLSRHPFKKAPGLTKVQRIRKAKDKSDEALRKLRFVAGDLYTVVVEKIEEGYPAEDLTQFNRRIRQAAARYEKARDATFAIDDFVIATLVTRDSKKIITITDAGEVILWAKNRRFAPLSPPRYLSLPGTVQPISALNSLTQTFTAAALSPDGKSLACGLDDGRIVTYDLVDVESDVEEVEAVAAAFIPQPRPSSPNYPRPGWEVTAISYSQDGRFVIAGLHKEGDEKKTDDEEFAEVGIFRAANLNLVRLNQRNLRAEVHTILPAADNHFITISSNHDSSIKIWQLPKGELVADAVLERDPLSHYLSYSSGPFDPIFSAALSPDGRFLATGSDGGNLSVWHVATARLVFTTRIQSDIRGLGFSADGKYLGTGSHLGDSRVYEFRKLVAGVPKSARGGLMVFVGAEPEDEE